jgi:predicted outer membrane repeat protein
MHLLSSTFDDLTTQAEAVIRVENSQNFRITNSTFDNANTDFLYVTGSSVTITDSELVSDKNTARRGLYAVTSQVTLNGSTFDSFYYPTTGAAFLSEDGDATVIGSTFLNNRAEEGAGIYFDCTNVDKCTYEVTDSTFTNNSATSKGGAMAFNYFPPTITNPTYANNSAIYGPDIAAYPYKIVRNSTLDAKYVSGQTIKTPIVFNLVDGYDEVILTDSSSILTISAVDQTKARVIGNTDVTVTEGVATFNDITFITTPGSVNIQYQITSSNINFDRLLTAYGITSDQVA